MKLFQQIMFTFSALLVSYSIAYYFIDYVPNAHAQSVRAEVTFKCQSLVSQSENRPNSWVQFCVKNDLTSIGD